MTDDDIWARDEVASPCKLVCVIHPGAGICVGCNRTRDEIARWSLMSNEERRDLMRTLPERDGLLTDRDNLPSRRTGRRNRRRN